jgi:hypothetical protein
METSKDRLVPSRCQSLISGMHCCARKTSRGGPVGEKQGSIEPKTSVPVTDIISRPTTSVTVTNVKPVYYLNSDISRHRTIPVTYTNVLQAGIHPTIQSSGLWRQ